MLARNVRRRSHAACKWVGRALCFVDDRYELPTRSDAETPDPHELNKGHAASRMPAIVVSVLVWTVVLGMFVAAYFMVEHMVTQSRSSGRVQLPLPPSQLTTLNAMVKYVENSEHPEPCVPASMFGLNARLVVIREKSMTFLNTVRRMANPVVEPDPDNDYRINGVWPTCSGSRSEQVTHAKYVLVKYMDPFTGQKHEMRYKDVDATCLLHADKVFSGEVDISCMRKSPA